MRYTNYLLLVFIFAFVNAFSQEQTEEKAEEQEETSKFTFTFTPTLGGTYTANSAPPEERENLEWLSQLQTAINYEGDKFHFDSDIFLQYGQIHALNEIPVKTQDDIILNLMPSYRILNTPSLRMFLQVKAESKLAEGIIDTQKTYFMDPMFLTNSLFFGEKSYLIKSQENSKFLITYGVGYSMQMIVKNKFKLVSEEEHTPDPEYVGGLSAILNVEFGKEIIEGLNFNFSFKSQAIAKNKIYTDLKNFRYSGIILSSIEYGIISINYTNRIIYDNELSPIRTLSQSLTMGLKYNF